MLPVPILIKFLEETPPLPIPSQSPHRTRCTGSALSLFSVLEIGPVLVVLLLVHVIALFVVREPRTKYTRESRIVIVFIVLTRIDKALRLFVHAAEVVSAQANALKVLDFFLALHYQRIVNRQPQRIQVVQAVHRVTRTFLQS